MVTCMAPATTIIREKREERRMKSEERKVKSEKIKVERAID